MELPHRFEGPLPERKEDETRMPCVLKDEEDDPLQPGLCTPALTLDVWEAIGDGTLGNFCDCFVKYERVSIHGAGA